MLLIVGLLLCLQHVLQLYKHGGLIVELFKYIPTIIYKYQINIFSDCIVLQYFILKLLFVFLSFIQIT